MASWVLAGAALCASSATRAGAFLERQFEIPVRLTSRSGRPIEQRIIVVEVRTTDAPPAPFLVLEHGRPAASSEFAALGRQDFPANARYFAAAGFVVFVPTRVGYGVSGGPDVEDTGDCAGKHPAAAVAAALAETRQLIDAVRRLPYVDGGRGLIVGQSFGGLIAVAAASDSLPGVLATVNVAGGDGGDSVRRPDDPCGADALRAYFARLGRGNRLPTLWMYSRNDRFWGPRLPREWFAAFATAGGRARFVELPADKNNGHFIFNRNAAAWHPAFEEFLAALGPGLSTPAGIGPTPAAAGSIHGSPASARPR